MSIRSLGDDDAAAAARLAVMAAFRPGRALPADALEQPHVRRWLERWPAELGAGWDVGGELRGAAWARRVRPTLIADETTGQPLPELIVAVDPELRGRGVGRGLIEALIARARVAEVPGLCLSVSRANPVAVGLYESVGFAATGETAAGLTIMTWRPGP